MLFLVLCELSWLGQVLGRLELSLSSAHLGRHNTLLGDNMELRIEE